MFFSSFNLDLSKLITLKDEYNGLTILWNGKTQVLTIMDLVNKSVKSKKITKIEAFQELNGWLGCGAYGFNISII